MKTQTQETAVVNETTTEFGRFLKMGKLANTATRHRVRIVSPPKLAITLKCMHCGQRFRPQTLDWEVWWLCPNQCNG